MNAAQQEVLDKVIELLSEHFDHAVVAVGWYDEDKQYSTTATYTGGVAPALGLCKLYETKWQKEHLWGPDEDGAGRVIRRFESSKPSKAAAPDDSSRAG